MWSCILVLSGVLPATYPSESVIPMAPKTGTRRAQFAVGPLGPHFESPKRPRDKTQTQNVVEIPGQASKRRRIMQRLEQLQTRPMDIAPVNKNDKFDADNGDFTAELDPGDEDYLPSDAEPDTAQDALEPTAQEVHNAHSNPTLQISGSHRCILPDVPAEHLYTNWKELIPTLVSPYLHYTSRTLGKPLSLSPQSISLCKSGSCLPKSTKILGLLFDHFINIEVSSCECSTTAQSLLHFGFFPTAPSQPRMAISVDLLAFYRALFERSCDAINALASTLHTHYIRRGFWMVNKDGMAIQEPFRCSLGSAVQWFDVLQIEVNWRIEAALQVCRDRIGNTKFMTPHRPFSPYRPSNPNSSTQISS